MFKSTTYNPETLVYLKPPRFMSIDSPANYALWALLHPWKSWHGYRVMAKDLDDEIPAAWSRDFKDKRVLVMGTGPSLDRAAPGFLSGFDTVVHINYALHRPVPGTTRYFFTTDLLAIVPMIERSGVCPLRDIGRDQCILAPVFFDQYPMLSAKGRQLFTVLRADRAVWRPHSIRLGPVRLPVSVRYHPRQPDWDRFALPSPGRTLPVIDHTSALSAVVFAAMNGARDIGLIGCDFSAGRAQSALSNQATPNSTVFKGAAQVFRRLQDACSRLDVHVVNHSWST